jgi:hypothetical protein
MMSLSYLCECYWAFALVTRQWKICLKITLIAWPLLVIAFWGLLVGGIIKTVGLPFDWMARAIKGHTGSALANMQEGDGDVD